MKWRIFLFCALITAVAGAQGVSWSINISPRNRKICKGDTISFSLENEQFIVPGLKNGEYVERISTSYRWKKNEATGYTNGDNFSIETGGNNGQGMGTFGVTVEGRAEYNIVWTDADTGVINRDGPHTVGWLALDSTNYTVVEADHDWYGWELGITSDLELMPNHLYDFINNKISNILSGINLKLKNISITGQKRNRDCCDSGIIILYGDTEMKGTFSISFIVEGRILEALIQGYGLLVPTTARKTISIPLTGTDIEILYDIDLIISSTPTMSGYIGKKKVLCEPQKECLFGGATVNTDLSLLGICQAISCIRNGSYESCQGVTLSAGASCNFYVDLNYNNNCDNHFDLKIYLGACKLVGTLNVWGTTIHIEKDLWNGIKIWD